MTRTPEQAKHVRGMLDRYDHAGDAAELVSQAAYEAINAYGFAAEAETFMAMCAGASWLEWWVHQLKENGKVTSTEAAKMVGVVQMGASVWAQAARDFRELEGRP